MKLTIRYEPEEIKTLIREDLVRQGITAAADASMELSTEGATVVVDAQRVGTLHTMPDPPSPLDAPVFAPPTPTPTQLAVVEGGAVPVDMSDVLGASRKLERERSLMDGESREFPGTPTPRR